MHVLLICLMLPDFIGRLLQMVLFDAIFTELYGENWMVCGFVNVAFPF